MTTPLTSRETAKRAERRVRIVTGLIGVSLTLAAGFLALSRAGGALQSLAYDIPYLAHSTGVKGVAIIYLDEVDGKALDRRNQAALLDKLSAAGARAVVYDLIFDIPSKEPEIDRKFAAAMLRFRGVDENGEPVSGLPRRQIFLACGRETFSQTGALGEKLIPPTDELLGAADDYGLVMLVCDDRYVVRELSTGTADEPGIAWKVAFAHGVNLDEAERMSQKWINYAKPADIPTFSAADLMRGDEMPLLLRDKIVVVGAKPGIVGAALGLDLFSSPFHRFDLRGDVPLKSGVFIQATSLANLLNGSWLTRSGKAFDNWMIIIAGVIVGLVFSWVRPARAMLEGIGAVVMLVVVAIAAMHKGNFWFPWTAVAFIQIPVALVWGTASHFYIERFFRAKLTEEQRMLKEAFEKYLSPQMLERMTEDGFQMKFGGEKVMAAMMFTDLESFTTMCERVGDPEKIVEALSDYFERTTGHIFEHDGVIIKFIGDAIFAAWGAPIADANAPVKAVRAAWHLSKNDKLVVEGVNLKTRIGVHYGEVVAGNIGSRKRVDYTMIGDAVNLAARLEGLNKMFGTRILISGDVREHLGDEFISRKVGNFRAKGRKESTVIYELLGPTAEVTAPDWLATYGRGLEALAENDFENARRFFAETNTMRDNGDGPSAFYLELLTRGAAIERGVYEMTEK